MNKNLLKGEENQKLFEEYKKSEEFQTVKQFANVLYNSRDTFDFRDILEETLMLYSFELFEIKTKTKD